ncbi:MAG: hypothetical protein LBE20_02655 [Deltaproteobacteria bacterium]|jgi:hypothetical protein|nr:hypothetical protein [Deltaproteobacteria bacterium]
MKYLKLNFWLLWGLILFTAKSAVAAVGCDLNDPDRDVKRFFPESTGYKTSYESVLKSGGDALLKAVEQQLGDEFQGLYETIDVPYTIYTIYKDQEIIGYIHGINQKGQYGGLQVFLIYNIQGMISGFYYQKLTSRKAKELRAPEFAKQFVGLSLEDFKDYNPQTGKSNNLKINAIQNPNSESEVDFLATLRAVKKNLILMKIFVFKN